MFKSIVLGIVGAGLATLASQAVKAQPISGQDPVSVRISYADLNLASPSGAREMMGRIENAARILCGEPSSNADLSERARLNACVSAATDDAVRSLDAPTVAALREQPRGAATFVASR